MCKESKLAEYEIESIHMNIFTFGRHQTGWPVKHTNEMNRGEFQQVYGRSPNGQKYRQPILSGKQRGVSKLKKQLVRHPCNY
ncbi:hypothetical protein DMN77_03330 [Paenibacillus sp. 79R4]|nr:hypothetical protein [Paenibacillus sp. 79R4]